MSICVKLSLCFLAENQLYFNKLKKKKNTCGEERLSHPPGLGTSSSGWVARTFHIHELLTG